MIYLKIDIAFGRILKQDMSDAIDSKTRTAVIRHVRYSTGFRQDLADLSKLIMKQGLDDDFKTHNAEEIVRKLQEKRIITKKI